MLEQLLREKETEFVQRLERIGFSVGVSGGLYTAIVEITQSLLGACI